MQKKGIPKFVFYVLPVVLGTLVSCSNDRLPSDSCSSFPEFPVDEMKEIFERNYFVPENDLEDENSLFDPGTVYPLWDSKEITVTREEGRLIAEVPIATRYRLKFARLGADGEIAEYGSCEDRIMIEKDEGSEECWLYLIYCVPEGKPDIGYSGVKIFTTTNGVLLRANHYTNGEKDGGVALSGDVNADDLSLKLDILARLCQGVGFKKVDDSCPKTKDSLDFDGARNYCMFGGSTYGYYYDDATGQGYGDITDPAICTGTYSPYVPIGPTLGCDDPCPDDYTIGGEGYTGGGSGCTGGGGSSQTGQDTGTIPSSDGIPAITGDKKQAEILQKGIKSYSDKNTVVKSLLNKLKTD